MFLIFTLNNFQCVCVVMCISWLCVSLFCLRKFFQAIFSPDVFLDRFITRLGRKNINGEFERYVLRKKGHFLKMFFVGAFFTLLFVFLFIFDFYNLTMFLG